MNNFNDAINPDHLRDCQKDAYQAIIDHFSTDAADNHVLIQLPTGTGKSALIAIMPFKIAKKKVLILTPNLTLAGQLETDLNHIDNPEGNIYRKLNIFTDADIDSSEIYTLKLDSTANFTDIEEHQIIVANYQQLGDVEKWFKGREDMIDLIIIDEAHHQKASTYQEIIKFFKNAKVIGLTATPFRSDGQKVDGKNIYTYHFRDAIKNGYIRNIKVSNVTPQEIELSFSDGDNKIYSLDDILKMKEESWFRRNIALSQDCCDSIARKAREKWGQLKKDFPSSSHQIIAAAVSVRHAREFVKPAFEKLGLNVGIVSSQHTKTNDETMVKLSQGKIDVIVNIGMLGEGFDHAALGVAAIFRPFASLNPYIQFIGRAIRRNNNVKHCYVVSHLGLNQTKRFDEFRLFDNNDQLFLEELLTKEEFNSGNDENDASFVDDDESGSENSIETIKIRELGGEVMDFESQFVHDEKISTAKKVLDDLSEEEKKVLFDQLGIDYSVSKSKKKKISPKNKRRAAKALLHEKEKSVVTDLIKDLGVKIYDRDFNPLRKNFQWISQKVSNEVNKRLGIAKNQRNDLSHDQLESFEKANELEEIKQECLIYFENKLKLKKK